MAKGNVKTYSLRGKITKVYEPREVVMNFGGKKVVKEVSDAYLQLETGPKVKVSFWDTDISHHEGAVVVISALQFKGKYKDVPQYSSTKETKISVAKKGKAQPSEETEEDVPEGAEPETEEPTFGDDAEPEGAVAEDEEPVGAETEDPEVPPPAKAKATASRKVKGKAIRGTASEQPATAHIVSPVAISTVKAVAIAAQEIVEEIAHPSIKKDPQAYQALFATIFINLGLKDYHANGGRD